MRTDRSRLTVLGRPRAQDASDGREESGQVGRSLFKEPVHVGTGRDTGPTERNNVPELGEGQPQSPALLDERQDAKYFLGIHAVAGRGPARRRQNPPRLVQPHRLAAGSAPFGDLADEKGVSIHVHTLNPALWGKVNHWGSNRVATPCPNAGSSGSRCGKVEWGWPLGSLAKPKSHLARSWAAIVRAVKPSVPAYYTESREPITLCCSRGFER